jgi:branched-subunit amino acid transport protein
MTAMWLWVLGACAIAYLTKLSGFLVPDSLQERPWVTTVSAGMTVGLLTSLVLANTVVTGTSLVLDARLVVLAAAAIALWLKAPYLVVVVVGAAAAALTRLAGF